MDSSEEPLVPNAIWPTANPWIAHPTPSQVRRLRENASIWAPGNPLQQLHIINWYIIVVGHEEFRIDTWKASWAPAAVLAVLWLAV